MCAYRFVAYRCCIGSVSVTWDFYGLRPLVFNGESSFAKTTTEILNSHFQKNPIDYADLRDMLHDMFSIHDMAFRPMEEVPSVQ